MTTKPLSLALLLSLSSLSTAHVKLKTPIPYGATTLNTNPIEHDGSDYPCKLRPGVYEISQINIIPIGATQTLSFDGAATHGGGACQISLTEDVPPTKDSVFKVIKSIEGGCPSTNPGNVGPATGTGADEFEYRIPEGVQAGRNYTLAWTWFNKIGEREMYMNCAPISVPANSKRDFFTDKGRKDEAEEEEEVDGVMVGKRESSSMASLPDMFRANIGAVGNGCSTAPSGTVLEIPKGNLGKIVQRIGDEPLVPPVGNCGGSYGGGGGNASPAPKGEGDGSRAAPPPAQSSPAPKSSPAPASPQNPFDAGGASGPVVVPISSILTAAAAAPAPSKASTPAAPPANSPDPSNSAAPAAPASGTSEGTCPTPGKSVCSPDGTAWGTCDENHHVIYQKVAEGTKCDPALGVEVHLKMGRRRRGFRG